MKISYLPLILLAVVAVSCGGGTASQTAVADSVHKQLVKVAVAYSGTVDQMESFTGTIQPFIENNISPSMGVRIDRIYVEVGDMVRKGQLLVEMDKSQYLQAEVQLNNLKSDLVRIQTLYSEGGVSKQQLDQMTTQVSVSQHAVDNLRENTKLLSPIDGVVTERVYDAGDMYAPGQGRIVTVMQMNRVKVKVNISEAYFPAVKVGMAVEVSADIYPDRVFEGKVSLIHPSIDAATRTFTAEITIPNADLKLRPGMFSRVGINFGKAESVLVPDIAVQKQAGSNERYLFVVKNGAAHRTTVREGRMVGENYEILSGVKSGDSVVVAGMQKLLDNTLVELAE